MKKTKTERIKELEEKLARLKEEEEHDDPEYKVWKNLLRSARKKYLGKTILINNVENECYWISEVKEIKIEDDDMLVFYGPGVSCGENCSACDTNLTFSNDIEGYAFYSDPTYYKLSDYITVFPNIEEMKKDVLKVVSGIVDTHLKG